jgi:hypothetical protein
MARQAARALRIYWDENKISGYAHQASQKVKQELPVVTSFEDDGPRVVTGNYGYSYEVAAFNDYADNLLDEILDADWRDGADHYLALCPLNTSGIPTENTVAYEAAVKIAEEPLTIESGKAQMIAFTAEGNSGLTRATVLRSASITGNGNGTGLNLGATAAGTTFMAVVRVISGTFTSFDVNIQESSDDGGGDAYATIATMSVTPSAAGVTYLSTTAATEAYKRVNVANWNGTSAVLLVTAGTVAGT